MGVLWNGNRFKILKNMDYGMNIDLVLNPSGPTLHDQYLGMGGKLEIGKFSEAKDKLVNSTFYKDTRREIQWRKPYYFH